MKVKIASRIHKEAIPDELTEVDPFVLEDGPCVNCIVSVMCKNTKNYYDILRCPYLLPIFYDKLWGLTVPNRNDSTVLVGYGDYVKDCTMVMVIPQLSINVWLQRQSEEHGYIDVMVDGVLKFVSLRIDFVDNEVRVL